MQIVQCLIGSPENILPTFDFEHLKTYYYIKEKKLVITTEQLNIIKNKKTYWYEENSLYPEQRLKKYKDRGWKILAT